MTDFRHRFDNHQVHNEINRLIEMVDRHRSDFKMENSEQRMQYARFLRAKRYAERSVKSVDPLLVTPTALNQLKNNFHTLGDAYQNFVNDKNWANLENQTDGLLDQLHRLPKVCGREDVAELAKTIHDFKQDVEKELESVKKTAESSIADLQAKQDKVNKKADSIKSRLDQYDQQLEAQKGRLDQLITEETQRFTQAESDRSKQYAKAEEKRQSQSTKAIEDWQARSKALVDDAETQFNTLAEEQKTTGAGTLEKLQEHLERAKRIIGLIGNTGMTGHYQKVANRNMWAAEILRAGAILFFVGLVAGVGWVVMSIGAEDFRWEVALFRVVVAATLLAPALYCAKESGKHREMEHRNRRIELELASINPYLDGLDPDKAKAIIEQLASKYFGNHESGDNTDKTPANMENINMRGEQVLQLLERIAKITK